MGKQNEKIAALQREIADKQAALRACLAKHGPMTSGQIATMAKLRPGMVSGALFRLQLDGEVIRDLAPGRKKDATYRLVTVG